VWRPLNTFINLKHHSNFKYYSLNLQRVKCISLKRNKNLQKGNSNNFGSGKIFFEKKKKFEKGFLYSNKIARENFKRYGKTKDY
jgi:hypothetical protein